MGNALDFLKDKKNRDKYRKGGHNSKCKKKIEEHKAKHGTTKCKEYNLIQTGVKGSNRVDQKQRFAGSLPSINARRFERRDKVPCAACKELYTPRKLKRPLLKTEREAGRNGFSIWCENCTARGTAYREKLIEFGGVEEYNAAKEESMIVEDIKKQTSLRILFEQLDLKKRLGTTHKMLDNRIEEIIEKAWSENEQRGIKHYEFDF